MVMLTHNGEMQNIWISKGIHNVQSFLWGGAENIWSYFTLRRQNDELARENFRLTNALRRYGPEALRGTDSDSDSAVIGGYRYVMADAVKVSNNKQHNYLILNKGYEDGIEELSGVVTNSGVIGIIDAIGRHYSYARSFKNSGMVVSARIGKEGPVGEIMWDGMSSNGAVLREIPHHIVLHQGDTVYTSGFSAIFPPDIPLGVTGDKSLVNGSFFRIDVRLFEDFRKLRFVTVALSIDKEEIEALENE